MTFWEFLNNNLKVILIFSFICGVLVTGATNYPHVEHTALEITRLFVQVCK